jgi:hypothetical protein
MGVAPNELAAAGDSDPPARFGTGTCLRSGATLEIAAATMDHAG